MISRRQTALLYGSVLLSFVWLIIDVPLSADLKSTRCVSADEVYECYFPRGYRFECDPVERFLVVVGQVDCCSALNRGPLHVVSFLQAECQDLRFQWNISDVKCDHPFEQATGVEEVIHIGMDGIRTTAGIADQTTMTPPQSLGGYCTTLRAELEKRTHHLIPMVTQQIFKAAVLIIIVVAGYDLCSWLPFRVLKQPTQD